MRGAEEGKGGEGGGGWGGGLKPIKHLYMHALIIYVSIILAIHIHDPRIYNDL